MSKSPEYGVILNEARQAYKNWQRMVNKNIDPDKIEPVQNLFISNMKNIEEKFFKKSNDTENDRIFTEFKAEVLEANPQLFNKQTTYSQDQNNDNILMTIVDKISNCILDYVANKTPNQENVIFVDEMLQFMKPLPSHYPIFPTIAIFYTLQDLHRAGNRNTNLSAMIAKSLFSNDIAATIDQHLSYNQKFSTTDLKRTKEAISYASQQFPQCANMLNTLDTELSRRMEQQLELSSPELIARNIQQTIPDIINACKRNPSQAPALYREFNKSISHIAVSYFIHESSLKQVFALYTIAALSEKGCTPKIIDIVSEALLSSGTPENIQKIVNQKWDTKQTFSTNDINIFQQAMQDAQTFKGPSHVKNKTNQCLEVLAALQANISTKMQNQKEQVQFVPPPPPKKENNNATHVPPKPTTTFQNTPPKQNNNAEEKSNTGNVQDRIAALLKQNIGLVKPTTFTAQQTKPNNSTPFVPPPPPPKPNNSTPFVPPPPPPKKDNFPAQNVTEEKKSIKERIAAIEAKSKNQNQNQNKGK